jgi:DMSO/TMAO reductase YedYZ molybdopterin-dependent catalytic subunit
MLYQIHYAPRAAKTLWAIPILREVIMKKAYRTIVGIALPILFSACLSFAQSTAASNTLTISGDIPAPLTLKLEDIAAMPHESATVTEEDGSKIVYEGVPLRDILLKAGAPLGKQLRGKNLASYVLAKAHDGYQVLFSVGELDPSFGNTSILVADKRDGKSLFEYQGPLRLVCANDKAGARSVRMLENIEVVRLRK